MKKFIKKGIAAVMSAVMAFSVSGCNIQYIEEETTIEETTVAEETEALETVTLNLWYDDEELTDYLRLCTQDYKKANANVEINLIMAPESEYEDNIIQQAVTGGNVDLYLIDNDDLEQMKLAGIAMKNSMSDIYNSYNYSQKAIDACTYRNELIAYPLTFETSFVVYNSKIIGQNIPSTFEGIKGYADMFEAGADSKVKSIFTCDLEDVFYNYAFLGGVLDIGGRNGDDTSRMFEMTDELSAAVTAYKQLIEFFYIKLGSQDYYDCLAGFESGEILFTIADMDFYKRVIQDAAEAAKEEAANEETAVETESEAESEEGQDMTEPEAEEDYGYVGVIPFPDMSNNLATSPLSLTQAIVVNPFSQYTAVAESLAKYITYTNADKLYDLSGSIACRRCEYEDDNLVQIFKSYDKSTPKLKLMYNDEFYALLEVSMHLMAKDEDDVQALTAVRSYLESHWNMQKDN